MLINFSFKCPSLHLSYVLWILFPFSLSLSLSLSLSSFFFCCCPKQAKPWLLLFFFFFFLSLCPISASFWAGLSSFLGGDVGLPLTSQSVKRKRKGRRRRKTGKIMQLPESLPPHHTRTPCQGSNHFLNLVVLVPL